MNILSLAQAFTSSGSESRRMMKSRQSKQALEKRQFVDSTLCSVIGNCSPTHAEQSQDVTDDSLHEEGGDAVPWRSCGGCAFLCAAHEPRCQVCGTENPFQKVEEHVDNVSTANNNNAAAETVDLLGLVDPREVKAPMGYVGDVASESTDEGNDDGEEYETDSEGEFIMGTLDMAPPAGTQVKVLYDDDTWYLADVPTSFGSKARVCFANGDRATIDFAHHAVRPADYAFPSDDECETSEDESDTSEDESEEVDDIGGDAKEIAQMSEAREDDEESEEDDLPGTLDEAPPAGTLVKILCDDNQWYTARVTASNGTKAMIVSGSDGAAEEEELDFDMHAVRLANYVCENEESNEEAARKETETERNRGEDDRIEQAVLHNVDGLLPDCSVVRESSMPLVC